MYRTVNTINVSDLFQTNQQNKILLLAAKSGGVRSIGDGRSRNRRPLGRWHADGVSEMVHSGVLFTINWHDEDGLNTEVRDQIRRKFSPLPVHSLI